MKKAFTLVELLITIAIMCIIVALIQAVLVGCSGRHVEEGKVCFRQFIPEHVETSTTYIHAGTEDCPVTIPITSSYTVPDKYIIKIEGIYKGKVRVRTIEVDRTSYTLLREGDWLKVSELPLTPQAEME